MDALVPAQEDRSSRRSSIAVLRGSRAGTIELLCDGAQTYPAWLHAIAGAQDEILLEMYWFASDKTGRRFADALAERARAGVDVRILYDAVGSIGSDSAMWTMLADAGAQIIEYHPLAPWRQRFSLSRISQRDHRKILVVDGSIAFTGGINIMDAAAPVEDGGEGWRDDAVKVTGWGAEELRRLFYDTWLKSGGQSPRRGGRIAARDRLALIGAARAQALRRKGLVEPVDQLQVIGHAARGAHRTMRSLYLWHIRNAEKRILISNAYFVPDPGVRRGLVRAARRGVEVRIIVPERSDVPQVAFASSAMFGRLLKAGVHLHLWQKGMIHAKTAVIDDWATVGSYNLDYRSLLYNLEVNVASRASEFVASLEASFREDLANARVLTLEEWKGRPLGQKIWEWLFYRLRKLL